MLALRTIYTLPCDTRREGYVTECSGSNDPDFHISSFSGNGSCVAVARLPNGDYVVRHSRRSDLQIIFTGAEWAAFVAGVKAAEFDF